MASYFFRLNCLFLFAFICNEIFAGQRVTNGKSFQVLLSTRSGNGRSIDYQNPVEFSESDLVLKIRPEYSKNKLIAFEIVTSPNPYEGHGNIFYTSQTNINSATKGFTPRIDILQTSVQKLIDPSQWERECLGSADNIKKHGHFRKMLSIVGNSKNFKDCTSKLENYYAENSVWKDLSRKERLKYMYNIANELVKKMKVKGASNYCKEKYIDKFLKTKGRKSVELGGYTNLNKKINELIIKKLATDQYFEDIEFISPGTRSRFRSGNYSDIYLTQEKLTGFVDEYYLDIIKLVEERFSNSLKNVGLRTQQILSKENFTIALEGSIKSDEDYVNLGKIDIGKTIRNFLQKKVSNEFEKNVMDDYPEAQVITDEIDLHMRDAISKFVGGVVTSDNINRLCFKTLRFLKEKNIADIDPKLYRDFENMSDVKLVGDQQVRNNKNIIHPDLNPNISFCINIAETNKTNFDPFSFNDFFCLEKGREKAKQGKLSRFSAIGMIQMVKNTFTEGVEKGIRGPEVVSFDHLDEETRNNPNLLFEYMINDPELQIEMQLRYLNYIIKRPYLSSEIKKYIKSVEEESGEKVSNLEKAIIMYDQHNHSTYIKKFNSCYNCMNSGRPIVECAVY